MRIFTLTLLLAFFAQFAFAGTQAYSVAKIAGNDQRGLMVTWSALLTGNTGIPFESSTHVYRVVQASGTFGGATVIMQGSNDGTNWVTLNDVASTPAAVSFTSTGMAKILMSTKYIRPSVSGGSGAAIDINLLLLRP